jgi:multidrug resistance efflux pump
MDVMIKRLDPNLPDPVESRRRAAGWLVRLAYAVGVFGVLGFFVVYFGSPFVFLSGPGTVSSARYVISLPYIVQVSRMDVAPGAEVKTGEEIGQVRSPQQDGVVATYMRALAELGGREAELRIKARVARDSLEAARSYLRLTEEAVERLETSGTANVSLSYQVEIHRERALARKTVVSQEAEVAEATVQLGSLDELGRQLRGRLDDVERDFGNGRVVAPIGGIVSTKLARVGESLVAGNAIAEILDPADVFVDWYIPNQRLIDPKVGNGVSVLFGNRRIPGKITEILPVSDVYAGAQPAFASDRQNRQIARIRFNPGVTPPPLNATVHVHMHYTHLAARTAAALVDLLGLH